MLRKKALWILKLRLPLEIDLYKYRKDMMKIEGNWA